MLFYSGYWCLIKVLQVLNAEIEKHSILSDVESHLGRVLVEVNFVAALDWMNTNLYLFREVRLSNLKSVYKRYVFLNIRRIINRPEKV